MKKKFQYGLLTLFTLINLISCAAMDKAVTIATNVGETSGIINQQQGESLRQSTAAVSRSLEDFTPEQEYYIGRSVGAVVLTKYPALANANAVAYLNLLGQSLAAASDSPEMFAGYHFLILDSDEINAFATPGGHVFITRGLIRCCRTEDALAAVLAHEIAHIQLRHGMKAIEKSRMSEALTIIAQEGAKSFGSPEVAQLTHAFGGAISDITNSMINKGYSRSYEYQADEAAVSILERIGYNPRALIDMLSAMGKHIKPGGTDFAKTHPSPENRIAELEKSHEKTFSTNGKTPLIREKRFKEALISLLKTPPIGKR